MKETPHHKIRHPETGDPNAYVADLTHVAEDVERELDAIDPSQLVVPAESDGKLLIVKDGAAAYRAIKGDGTIDEDGNFQLGAGVVGATELGDKAVTTAKLDDDSVTSAKIGPDQVGSSEIVAGAVGESELATDAVTAAKIKENAVGSSEIAAGAVGESELGDGSVSSQKLKPTAGLKQATGLTVSLTGAYADIAGTTLEITPAVASLLKVTAVFRWDLTNSGAMNAQGTLNLDGVDQSQYAMTAMSPSGALVLGATAVQVFLLALSAEKHTIKMRAKKELGTAELIPTHTRMLYELVAS